MKDRHQQDLELFEPFKHDPNMQRVMEDTSYANSIEIYLEHRPAQPGSGLPPDEDAGR